MKKCKYCGKKLNGNFEFCNSKCENCYEKMVDKDSHKIKYFILGIILGFLVMFYGIISNNNVFIIGIGMSIIAILALTMGLFENILPAFFVYIALGIILVDVVVIIILGNTLCRK